MILHLEMEVITPAAFLKILQKDIKKIKKIVLKMLNVLDFLWLEQKDNALDQLKSLKFL